MTQRPIRLVAIDIDDTLLTDDLQIAPGTRKIIARAMDEGVFVTLATGRMFPSTRPIARELGMDGPLITYNGALIRTTDGDTWWHKPVPRSLALEVLEYAEADGWTVQCYLDDKLYVTRIDEGVRHYTDIANVPAQAVKDMRALLTERDSTKLLGIGDADETVRRVRELEQKFAGRLTITTSKPEYVEMLDAGVSKATALAEVARRLGIEREQIMAVGDSFNDLDMLRWAGVGVAMGNAAPEIQAMADHVVGSNEDDGVVEAFERFVFV